MTPINTNLVEEAKELLPNQFFDKTNVNIILREFVSSLKGSNDTIFNTLDSVNLGQATGYLLDCVGSYLAVLRNGDLDSPFRARIQRKLLTSASEGTPNDLLETLSTITEGTTRLWEHFPVSTIMETNGKVIPPTLAGSMQEASPASSGDIVVCINPDNNTHRPSELGFDTIHLVNKSLDHFVTSNVGEHIVINSINFGGVDENNAKLSEFTYGQGMEAQPALPDGLGILCEISHKNGGVTRYDYQLAQVESSVNGWYKTIQFEIPQELI